MNAALGIIGSAGRGSDAARLTAEAFDRMYDAAVAAADDWGVTGAVSGGAAWADHLAVRGFLEGRFSALTLHLPIAYADGTFADRGDGAVANRYHRAFSAACGFDSLGQIGDALRKGAVVQVGPGFKARNISIGRDATHLVAFTFGAGRAQERDFSRSDPGYADRAQAGLKDGGTAHCWGQANGPSIKRHVDLGLLLRPGSAPAP